MNPPPAPERLFPTLDSLESILWPGLAASTKRRIPVATPTLVVIPCWGSTITVGKANRRMIFA